jgi:hypothetical protein
MTGLTRNSSSKASTRALSVWTDPSRNLYAADACTASGTERNAYAWSPLGEDKQAHELFPSHTCSVLTRAARRSARVCSSSAVRMPTALRASANCRCRSSTSELLAPLYPG